MKLIGKAPINPALFYTGKIAGYVIWTAPLMGIINASSITELSIPKQLAIFLALISIVLISVSLINLGSATRLGLPQESTQFKTKCLYMISRNPMYLGFNLLSLSAILLTGNFIVLVLGTYSIFTYHQIIQAEEAFLEARFGEKYCAYKSRVRRYI
jgi:protein-S-isoprenylcysteine O-methyltransferase Ste14